MKTILINPPEDIRNFYGNFKSIQNALPPIGLAYLAGYLRSKGIKVEIIDAPALGLGFFDVVNRINQDDIVGITAVTTNIESANKLAELIKNKNNNIKIIIGGPHVSGIPEETLNKFKYFDIGVIGEGEETFYELVSALKNKRSIKTIKGIVLRDKGKIIQTQKRESIKNLDELPFPAWDLLPDLAKNYQPSPHNVKNLPSASLVTSRGCPGRCTFCAKRDRTIRIHSADYIVTMIKDLVQRYGIKEFIFMDDMFLISKARIKKLYEKLKNERIKISWSCAARADFLNDIDLLKIMKESGCWQVMIGIESGNEGILKNIKKDITLDKIRKALENCRKTGISSKGYFIIGNPGETKETMIDSFRFAKNIPLDFFVLFYFTPYPGTESYQTAEKYGKIEKDWSKMTTMYPVFIPNGVTRKELERMYKKGYQEFYFRPMQLIRLLSHINFNTFYGFLKGAATILRLK